MYRQYSFLLILPLLFSLTVIYVLHSDAASDGSVNAVLGDESYLRVFGEYPDETVSEEIRIKTHLKYVEGILRKRPVDHLTEEQRMNRSKHLDHLREYILAGKFPRNDGHTDQRRPTFISKNGHICAVGYLLEQDVGREKAEAINEEFKYEYIPEIDDPVLQNWADSSGFTIHELAMIQPMYGPAVVEEIEQNKNRVDLSYGIGSSVLTSANILYHSNNPRDPWLFNNTSSNHWFGLTAGSASVLLGALNLDNSYSYTEPLNSGGGCVGVCHPAFQKVTATNHSRTALSVANMGVGFISIIRSGYHLIKGTEGESQSKTSVRVTQLEANPTIQSGEPVPGVQLNVRF